MKLPSFLPSFVAVSVVLTLGVAADPTSPPARATAQPKPIAVEGDLQGTSGADVTGTALVEPVVDEGDPVASGDVVDFFHLPHDAVTVADDVFTVRIDPTEVPARYVAEGGLVTLLLDFTDGSGREAHHVTTVQRIGAGDAAAWADPLADNFSSEAAFSASTSEVLSPPRERVQLVDTGRETGSADPKGAFSVQSGAQCVYGSATSRSATVGTSYPVGKRSRSWLTYGSSSNTTFGAAVTYGNGWSASGSKTVGDSWGQNFTKSRYPRSYRVTIRYRKQVCYLSSGYYSHTHWLPWYETGGTAVNRLSSRPNWNTCDEIAPGEWWRGVERGTDYKLATGVKFAGAIGIDLRTQRAYTSASRLWYDRPTRRRLCGNTNYPAVASKLRERNL
jgi:hypothetical protein